VFFYLKNIRPFDISKRIGFLPIYRQKAFLDDRDARLRLIMTNRLAAANQNGLLVCAVRMILVLWKKGPPLNFSK
jgi:hypothetical protein